MPEHTRTYGNWEQREVISGWGGQGRLCGALIFELVLELGRIWTGGHRGNRGGAEREGIPSIENSLGKGPGMGAGGLGHLSSSESWPRLAFQVWRSRLPYKSTNIYWGSLVYSTEPISRWPCSLSHQNGWDQSCDDSGVCFVIRAKPLTSTANWFSVTQEHGKGSRGLPHITLQAGFPHRGVWKNQTRMLLHHGLHLFALTWKD